MTDSAWGRWMLLFTLMDLGFVGYQSVVRPDRTARTRAAALYGTADRYEKAERFDDAVRVYESILEGCATAPTAPRAAWSLAQIQTRKRFRPDEARVTLRNLLEAYPQSDLAPQAASNLAFLESHADHEDEPLRRWLRASEANRAGNSSAATEILTSLLRDYPDAAIRPQAEKILAQLARNGSRIPQ